VAFEHGTLSVELFAPRALSSPARWNKVYT
jgi:hypothetical protein